MEHNQVAARVRLALEREAARHQVSPGAWPRIERRLHRHAWRRAGATAGCVAVIAATATAVPYLWHAISHSVTSHRPPAPQLILAGRTHLSRGITHLAAGYGAVWVVGPGVIYRVDQATGTTAATIPVPGTATKLSDIAVGASAVWATGKHDGHFGVYRIDPHRNRITSFIRLPPTPTGITVAYGQVWVTEPKQGPGTVVRIDPRTNSVSGPPIRVGTGPGRPVPGAGALWVTNGDSNGSVSRINPATSLVTRTLVNVPDVDAAGAGSLWGTLNQGGIQRIDPATGQVTATIRLPNAVGVTFWAGSAWVSTQPPGGVVRIDPTSNRVAGKATAAGTSPTYIAASPRALWVADFSTGDLLHLAR